MPSIQDYLKQYEDAAVAGAGTPDDEINFSKMALQPAAKAPTVKTGGFVPAVKQAIGQGLVGAGQAAADFIPGVSQGNALTQYGQSVVDANPTETRSLEDIAAHPGTALKEATGNAAGSIGLMAGTRALGMGVTAAAPLAGPLAPLVAGTGQAIAWGGPWLAAALPSFGGIRARQIEKSPTAEASSEDKLKAALGAGTVGLIEGKFGPESWALALFNKNARNALAEKFVAKSLGGSIAKAGVTGAAVEGAEELVQNPIEQMSAGDNPLDSKNIQDTLFGGAMGALGGAGAGSVFGMVRNKPASQVTPDDLKAATDEVLAPPAEPAPMQAEYEQAQREFALANQPQGNQYPALAEASDTELQRMSELLASEAGKKIAGAQDIQTAIAQELAARAPQPETLAQQNDRLIAEAMAPQPELPEIDPLAVEWQQREQELAQRNGQTARLAQVRQEQAQRAASVQPTVPAAAQAGDRAIAVQEGRDLFGIVQEPPPAAAPSRQTEALTGELNQLEQSVMAGTATPQDVARMQQVRDALGSVSHPALTAQDAAPLIAAVPTKVLRGQDRARLAKAPVEELPDRIYTMWKAKGGMDSKSDLAPVLDELYTQVTGQRIQDHENVGVQQASQALQVGMQAAPTQGRIENIQGALAAVPILTKQARMKALRATQASVEAGQQPAAVLGQNIPEAPDAIQEPVTEGVDVQQPAQTRQEMAKRNAKRNAAAQKGQAEGKVNATTPAVVEQGGQRASDNTSTSARTGVPAGTGTQGGVRGRAGASARSNGPAVAVGSAPAERAAGVVEEQAQEESPYARSKTREHELKEYVRLYENLKFPEGTPASKRTKTKVAYLASIAEVEYEQTRPKKGQTAEQAAKTREESPARKYLDALPAAVQGEVAQARREAATRVHQVGELEVLFKAQNDAVAKLIEAQDAQLAEYEKPTKRKKTQADKSLEKQFRQMDESGAAQGFTAPGFHTQTSLAVELAKTFGQKFMDALKTGRVVILPDQLHLAAVTGKLEHRMQSNQGLYVYNTSGQSNGITYFVAGNISKTVQGFKAVDIALHEIGEHAGMQHMLGKQNYVQLLTRIRVAMAKNDAKTPTGKQFDKDVAAAQKRLLQSQQGNPREVLAYMIQHTPDASILTKMWSQVKAWLIKRGWMDIDRADAQVLRALAEGATNKWLTDVGTKAVPSALKPGASEVDFSGAKSAGMTSGRFEDVLNTYGYADGRARAGIVWMSPQEFLDATASLGEQARLKAEIEKYGQANLAQSVPIKLGINAETGQIVDHEGRHRMLQLAQAGVSRVAVVIDRNRASNDPFPTMFLPQKNNGNNGFAAAAGIVIPITYDNATELKQKFTEGVDMAFSGVSSPTTLKTLTDYKTATGAAQQVLAKVTKAKPEDMKLSVFKTVIPWFTKHHLISQFDKWFNGGLTMNGKADSIQETMTTRMNQLFNEPHQRFLAIERADKERAKKITELMQATEFQIDPRKSWAEHTHLHSLTGWQLQQAKDYVAQYGQIWGKMKMNPEDRKVYNDLAQMNETMYTAELALGMYNMVQANPGAKNLKAFQADPSEKFRESTTVHGSIDAAQDYWRGVLDNYTAELEKHVAEQRGLLPQKQESDPEYQQLVKSVLRGIQSDKAKQVVRRALKTREDKGLTEDERTIVRHLSPLEVQLRQVAETTATFDHAPYFHLGRFGDHFVSFRVRTGEGELADPVAMEHVQRELAKKYPDITIRSDATDPHVFARFESADEAGQFEKDLRDMQKQGWLMQPGVKDKNNQDLGEIVAGSRNDVISGYHTAGPNWLTRVVESIQSLGYDDATEERMIADMRALYLDSLPDNAAIKVKQKREGRPGWSADLMRSYAHRMRIGSNRVGTLAAEPTRTQSFAIMKDAQKQAQQTAQPNKIRRAQIAAVLSEFERRNSDQMNVPNTPAMDKLRAMNHAYFLGMSPAYVLMQMTQLGALTWPELSKKNGFVKSAKAIAEATPIALRIMRTVITEGYKQRGIKGAADMVVTSEMLEKAGVSKEDAEFLTKVMAAGKIDIGNAAREIGRVAEGETGSQALKIASSFGYASETVTRITTALASKRLYDAKPAGQKPASDAVKYAIGVIDESMLNYTSTNIGRMTGKQGVAGTWTPVMFSFLQYQFQLLEKMYREFYTAFTSREGMTKKEKDEARRFLASHMFSMLTLAGTLGLPFATAIAAAADKLCSLGESDYCDSKTAMRNMTAEVFGHDIEPLISKGWLPRALGTDISERAGEGNLLPFSKFLADKRKMQDALKDLAWSSWGAPSSMLAGVYKGYERMADGDLMGGMQEAVPLALKGPIKAFEMSEKGYTDKAGNVLPMTPGARDIMWQTIGFNPGEKADYQQAKFAQSQRKGVLTRESTMIRQKLASAIERGDQADMRDWMSKARDYDAKNPERGILTSMEATLRQRALAKAQAMGTGTPLGVSPKDYEAQKFTSFYRPQ
jgi:hypothetical protein